jgi:hypothetical protein
MADPQQEHPRLAENGGVYEDDVGHRQKGGEPRQNLHPPGGLQFRIQFRKLKIALQPPQHDCAE